MNWEKIGSYLGREIFFAQIQSISDYENHGHLGDSTLVVFLETDCFEKTSIQDFFKEVAGNEPLCVAVGGNNSDATFTLLLETLSKKPSRKHIMTYVFEEIENFEWLESFIKTAWPAEERHDDWKKYSVLAISGDLTVSKLRSHIQEFFPIEIPNSAKKQ
jgi:Cft2 family RNA processing exonuclease